jgi:hypothetical protein
VYNESVGISALAILAVKALIVKTSTCYQEVRSFSKETMIRTWHCKMDERWGVTILQETQLRKYNETPRSTYKLKSQTKEHIRIGVTSFSKLEIRNDNTVNRK